MSEKLSKVKELLHKIKEAILANKKKSIIIGSAVILALAVTITVVVLTRGNNKSNKESETNNNTELSYDFDSGRKNYTVVGIGNCTDEVIEIPAEYNGYPVVGIGEEAFLDCDNIKKVKIPDSVIEIEDYAFSRCDNLTDVILGSKVTHIGEGAFASSGINKITIPDSVKKIDYRAFFGCMKLHTVVLGRNLEKIVEYAFERCYNLVEIINYSNLDIQSGQIFMNGGVALYALEIHSGESRIVNKDDYIFYTYKDVNYLVGYIGNKTNIVLPQNYNGEEYEIHEYAFRERFEIISVVIPTGVTKVGKRAFYNANKEFTIYCEVSSVPNGWDEEWNESNSKVVWGYTGE